MKIENQEQKENLTARIDMLVKPSMKEKLQKLAERDNRELSDYIRLQLSKLIK